MYVTAQKVESRETGKIATNVFVYLHGTPGRPVLQSVEQLTTIADSQPGMLVHADVDVAPGGNAILSYLDIVAPDGTQPETIERTLLGLAVEPLAQPQILGAIGVRFNARIGENREVEFAGLRARLVTALRQPKTGRGMRRPLTVTVRGEERDLAFFLDDESEQRVESMGGRSTGLSIKVSRETKDDFEAVFGSIYRHVLPVITNLELEQILLLGGVVFRAEHTGRVLWQWPKAGVDVRPPIDMKSLESVVSMARRRESQAVRADTIALLRRELDQSSADNPSLPTLTRWLHELEEMEKHP